MFSIAIVMFGLSAAVFATWVEPGIGYISPVSTLIKWYPDGPGLAYFVNTAGRFAWSSTSDLIGRKPIYLAYGVYETVTTALKLFS